MKRSILIALFGMFMLSLQAQESRPHCYTSEVNNPLLDSDPQYRLNQARLEQFTADWVAHHSIERQSGGGTPIYIIPVVFHILHDYGPENVSDAEIREAVRLMNIDYQKQNADTAGIIPPFQSIAANVGFEFRIATIDPNGNCTSGIEHLWTLKTYHADDNSKTNAGWTVWPTSKYMNIWVANTLDNPDAAAYAHLPGVGANNVDGIMCWYTYVDNIQRTLTHEAGHHFNLQHPWGQTNQPEVSCGDDQVFDTPITKGYSPGHCPSNEPDAQICNPGITENWQNFMDYSYCDNMFTEGQKQRMIACLNDTPNTANDRSNLWQTANLIATGTDQIYPVTCSPKADFKTEAYAACVNSPVRFFDQSWKGTPDTWSWEFPGGTPSVSNDTNPIITYATPGVYSATLVTSNQYGSDTIVKTALIHISGPAQTPLPWSNDFESGDFPGIDGWVDNNDGGSINWSLVNFASSDSGTNSIKINNYTNTVRNIEDWITPSFDFTGVTFPIKVSFDLANAQRNVTTSDELRLYYSTDCGNNWQPTNYTKIGPTLATNGGAYVSTSFTPNATQWRRDNVTVNAVQNMPMVRFKFENTTARGNNVYIDNINITGNFTGIDEESNVATSINVYPNPSEGYSTVNFNLIKGAEVSLEVKDIIGQSVSKVVSNKKYESGLHQVAVPLLTPGIYVINVTVNNRQHAIKLVVS
jgi:PKD repeat protein